MIVPFTKMHGIGNDFIVIDTIRTPLCDPAAFAQKYCDRHFGVGADQLLLVAPSDRADYTMKIYNADGSEVEMCGNGIRCIARYISDNGLSDKSSLAIDTMAGIMYPALIGDQVKVNMGTPILEPARVPVALSDGPIVGRDVTISGAQYTITTVSMGNPHCIIFVDDVDAVDLSNVGPLIECASIFPNRINVEFVQVLSDSAIRVRVWERGSGITLACGTGACASAVAAHLNNKTGSTVTVTLPGGDLQIAWEPDGPVFMTGPAETVFTGTIQI